MAMETQAIPNCNVVSRREVTLPSTLPLTLQLALYALHFTILCFAIAHYAYVGQDFFIHLHKILTHHLGFSYANTNPPGFYAVGNYILRKISPRYVLEVTSLTLVVANIVSMVLLKIVIDGMFTQKWVRWAAFLTILFVPFRSIWSVIISADGLTLLPYVLLILVYEHSRAFSDSMLKLVLQWGTIGTIVLLGVYEKYSAIGYVPALALLGFIQWREIKGSLKPILAALLILSLLAPSVQFLRMMKKSTASNGYKHWRDPGTPAEMDWNDLLVPKWKDLQIVNAPTYGAFTTPHQFSYFAILHTSVFSDTLNQFQPNSVKIPVFPRPTANQEAYVRLNSQLLFDRNEATSFWSRISVRGSLLWTFFSLFGSLYCAYLSVRSIFSKPRAKSSSPYLLPVCLLSFGFFLPLYLSLPFTGCTNHCGYFMPRLIMPSLIGFLLMGFYLLDKAIKKFKFLGPVVVGYASLLSVVYILALNGFRLFG